MNPITPRQVLSRRTLLKGLGMGAGSLLLGGWSERLMAADGPGKAGIAPRFVFVLEGSGLHPDQVSPKNVKLKQRNARTATERFAFDKDTVLPTALTPLAAYQNKMTVVQGLSGKVAGGGHSGNQGALGCYSAFGSRRIAGPTIDCLLGQHFPGILPSITLGISAIEDPIGFNCSAIAANKAQATLMRPDQAYSRLFGAVGKDRSRAVFNARANLLDFMVDDIRRAERAVGAAGKAQLDAYLESFDTLAGVDARMVAGRDKLSSAVPEMSDDFTSDSRTARLRAHFKLASASLIGGLTNVVTIASGVGFEHFDVQFDEMGFETGELKGGNFSVGGKHGIGHQVGAPNAPNYESNGYKAQIAIRKFHLQQIADLLGRLEKIPEGSGTMADNTVVVYLSDAAETHHSTMNEWPMVMTGNLKGKLRSGHMLVYPNYGRSGHGTTARLYCSLLHAVGKKQDTFGELDPNLDTDMQRGPLKEVLA